ARSRWPAPAAWRARARMYCQVVPALATRTACPPQDASLSRRGSSSFVRNGTRSPDHDASPPRVCCPAVLHQLHQRHRFPMLWAEEEGGGTRGGGLVVPGVTCSCLRRSARRSESAVSSCVMYWLTIRVRIAMRP